MSFNVEESDSEVLSIQDAYQYLATAQGKSVRELRREARARKDAEEFWSDPCWSE